MIPKRPIARTPAGVANPAATPDELAAAADPVPLGLVFVELLGTLESSLARTLSFNPLIDFPELLSTETGMAVAPTLEARAPVAPPVTPLEIKEAPPDGIDGMVKLLEKVESVIRRAAHLGALMEVAVELEASSAETSSLLNSDLRLS